MKEIDARGLACPAPVLQAKAALQKESPNGVRVVVDNAASQQNVQRFLESQGFQTVLEQVDSDYVVIGNCDSMSSVHPQPATETHLDAKKIMVMYASDRLGFGHSFRICYGCQIDRGARVLVRSETSIAHRPVGLHA